MEQQEKQLLDAQSNWTTLNAEFTKERILALELRGQVKHTIFQEKFLTFTRLQQLQKIKETKSYRGLPTVDEQSGEVKYINTFREYCESVNLSVAVVDEALANLRDLGEDLYQSSVKLGLTAREMRRLRKLPDETIIDIAKIDFSEDEDKSRLVEKLAEAEKMVEKLSDTIEEQAEQLAETVEKLDKKTEDYEAQSRVLENKDKNINRLSTDLAKRQRLIEKMTPDEVGGVLREEAAQLSYSAEVILRGNVRSAFKALTEHSQKTGVDHKQFMSGIIAEYMLILSELKQEFGISDTPSEDGLPEWARNLPEQVEIDDRTKAILDAEILG
ncbi:hypothetical protein [Haemophilus sputorum]|uniref:DUF3102 domain-containing protein n=1 Tax=Haemophilus sputorum TaxID=1078480 RepID=A0ABX9HQL8_9PAST|nr:hypothetical protein [Haemophilus sputorum]RDF07424.1 hypothetical protein DPV80_07120 [Haemophilus sputorum]RDF11106.1 hypothetical protein DPV84_05605 [Haemophilus sputorum]